MATITGFTAERMLVIEKETVIDGEVVGNNLHLIQRGGVVIDAGNVRGPTGATGATGPPGTNGTNGTNGHDGLGVPAGGTALQILSKNSSVDNDSGWKDHYPSFAPVKFRVTQGAQSIPRIVWTNLTSYGVPSENVGGGTFSGGVFTIPATGRYQIVFCSMWVVPASTTASWGMQQQYLFNPNPGGANYGGMSHLYLSTPGNSNTQHPISLITEDLVAGTGVVCQVYNGHPSAAMSILSGYGWFAIDRVG